ncbi:AraC family transcriptional regulator [Herbaspirillum sp. HC18]|nr:AraC family transcriptional regulator [Herbaspirillum sp. HC18]
MTAGPSSASTSARDGSLDVEEVLIGVLHDDRALETAYSFLRIHAASARRSSIKEPGNMDETLEPPRFADGKELLIAGMGERYNSETVAGIAAQWKRFRPHLGSVPGQVDNIAYGVCCNGDDAGNFDYVCGVEVRDVSGVPQDWSSVRIPARRYAVFTHRGQIADIKRTHHAIWSKWLPASGYETAKAPNFERYGEDFDGQTGMGAVEIWIPLKD